jgi:AcrR family transcriptional regulator
MGRPAKTEERSEEIMQAFEACVLRKGLLATTLADVADESGLPRSLVRYFIGNRDEMVDRLVERLMTLAMSRIDAVRDQSGAMPVTRLLDAWFGEVFADERSNALMGELWYLARTDPHIRERVTGVYAYATSLLTDAMARESIGSDASRQDAAFAVLALALGQTSLNDFGLAASADAMRDEARRIVHSLSMETSR